MKGIPNLFIVIAAICTVVGVFSRISLTPVAGIESRAMIGFAALCLLFSIAISLQGKEK